MTEPASPERRRSDARDALAAALKVRLRDEALDRVTVTELARDCGLTRQAFYYHFRDVRQLAVWVFETEVAEQVRAAAASSETWADGLVRLLQYLRENRSSTVAVLDGVGRSRLERYLFAQMRPVTEAVVAEVGGGGPRRAGDRARVVDHYTSVVLAVVLRWVAGGMVEHPYRLVGDLELMMHGSVRESVRRLDDRSEPDDGGPGRRWGPAPGSVARSPG
ncbi:TetR-like C-terminal domain-containing protein [Cellulomonas endometrii]|uniref:TetR-like C-terminal domain-containing protein n=1 Tax=Cellulomonas endometrii TaxID=3036301 RepID=UPI0024ACA744|nr:TetR-like C-terminal domain-containing protein [Cellulomonas endometrii]